MKRRMTHGIVLALALTGVLGGSARPAEGQTLLQRLFPRLAARRAQRMAAWTVYRPDATWNQSPAPVVVGYAPQVQYRTVWATVPVTQYRPVTWTNPSDGRLITVMRPCSTYAWQARRVAYTAIQPVYAPMAVAAPSACQPVAGIAVTSTVAPAIYAPATTSGPGYADGSAFSPSPGLGGSPTPPGPTLPSSPSTPSPISPSGPTTWEPAQTVPGGQPSVVPGADTRPSLAPADVPRAREGRPADGQPETSPGGMPGGFESSGPSDSDSGSGASGASETRGMGFPSPNGQAPSGLYLKPIPARRTPAGGRVDDVPQLIDPRDQTASQPPKPRWEAVPISWSEPIDRSGAPPLSPDQTEIEGPPVRTLVVPAAPSRPRWDDRGWRASSR
jgi:hypothetical protein